MKNTHIEHPEDTILTGDLSVLDWFTGDSYLSTPIDRDWETLEVSKIISMKVLLLIYPYDVCQ